MSSKLKVLQVIPRLDYGGAEIGCYDLAHYLSEQKSKSYIATSGGKLTKYINKKKVKLFKIPVHSKNPILMILNIFILSLIVLFLELTSSMLEVEHLLGRVILLQKLLGVSW